LCTRRTAGRSLLIRPASRRVLKRRESVDFGTLRSLNSTKNAAQGCAHSNRAIAAKICTPAESDKHGEYSHGDIVGWMELWLHDLVCEPYRSAPRSPRQACGPPALALRLPAVRLPTSDLESRPGKAVARSSRSWRVTDAQCMALTTSGVATTLARGKRSRSDARPKK
jgi:hypothetical protein